MSNADIQNIPAFINQVSRKSFSLFRHARSGPAGAGGAAGGGPDGEAHCSDQVRTRSQLSGTMNNSSGLAGSLDDEPIVRQEKRWMSYD